MIHNLDCLGESWTGGNPRRWLPWSGSVYQCPFQCRAQWPANTNKQFWELATLSSQDMPVPHQALSVIILYHQMPLIQGGDTHEYSCWRRFGSSTWAKNCDSRGLQELNGDCWWPPNTRLHPELTRADWPFDWTFIQIIINYDLLFSGPV